jgi:hypothetical protein
MKLFPTICIRIQIQEGQDDPEKKVKNLSFVELDVLLWRAGCSSEAYMAFTEILKEIYFSISEGKK